MGRLEEAIEAAYQAHVTSLYNKLVDAVIAADGNKAQIDAAEARFKEWLALAADVRARARKAAEL